MALLHDAVDVFYHGLIQAELNESVRVERVSCDADGEDTWTNGERLYSYLREVSKKTCLLLILNTIKQLNFT